MLGFGWIVDEQSPGLQLGQLLLNGEGWFLLKHCFKKEDSPWYADLMGSVASSVPTKITLG